MLVLRLSTKQQEHIDKLAKAFKEEQTMCASAIEEVMSIYSSTGYRKVNVGNLPLRFEVDSFLARIVDKFVGDRKLTSYPLLESSDREKFILQNIEQWKELKDFHLLNKATNLYPQLEKVFSSVASIHCATDQQIGDSLRAIRTFYASSRFAGGFQVLIDKLFTENNPIEVRDILAYLIHGRDSYEERLAIFTVAASHDIKYFGSNSAKELLGWCDKEDIMLFTDKSKKALRYLGFDIAL